MKVIQYGCGKMAKYTMRYVLENNWEIVGAVDINPNVIGKDISEVIGCENVGVKITSVEDADALFNEVKADVCIVTVIVHLLEYIPALILWNTILIAVRIQLMAKFLTTVTAVNAIEHINPLVDDFNLLRLFVLLSGQYCQLTLMF